MRADDIELGVEYCVTGPLAYGVEPHTPRPDRVKFTQRPRSGWGRLTRFVSEENPSYNPDRKGSFAGVAKPFRWKRTANDEGEVTWVVNVNDNYVARHEARGTSPMNLPTPTKAGEVAFTFETLKGHYPCLRWNREQEKWDEGIAQPAAIHRTWAEYLQQNEAAKERKRQQDITRAPSSFHAASRDLAKWAVLAGYSLDDVIEQVQHDFEGRYAKEQERKARA